MDALAKLANGVVSKCSRISFAFAKLAKNSQREIFAGELVIDRDGKSSFLDEL